MLEFVLNYREEMFKFEKFKEDVRDKDKLILLVEYEKKVREYMKKYEETKMLLDSTITKINEEKTIRKDVQDRTKDYLTNM